MISKLLGGSTLMLALAAAVLYGLWQREQVKVAKLESQIENLNQAIKIQEQAIAGLQKDKERVFELINTQQAEKQKLADELKAAQEQTNANILQIERLKQGELRRALQEPFERGNAASDRTHRSLCRLFGTKSGDCADKPGPASTTP